MAVNDYIKVFYELEENGLLTNHDNQVRIVIQSQLDIGFENVTCKLGYQIQGLTHSNITKLHGIIVDQNKSWKKGQKYEYDKTITLEDAPISFRGNNVNVLWWLYLEVELDQNSKSEIQSSLFKDIALVNLLKSFDGKHENKNLILVQNATYKYGIDDFSLTYTISAYIQLVIGIFILILSVILFVGEIIKKHIWIPILAGIGFLGYGIYEKIGIGTLKKVNFKGIYEDNENFNLQITVEKNFKKIRAATIYYQIKEEVIDNRGTTSTTRTSTIFESQNKTVNSFSSNIFDVSLPYPKNDLPLDFYRSHIRYYSELVIEFEFHNNTKGRLRQEFPLKKAY